MSRMATTMALAALLGIGWLALPAPAAAHCDSMDGPVVTAAREALATGRVEGVLAWVRARDEAAIRTAFQRTLEVRRLGGEARELADLWFFETLVRIHREGEGAPYTGLKPAGSQTAEGIEAADRALEEGSVEAVATGVAEHLADAVRRRFEEVQSLKDHTPTDVAAGRAYVHAYVEFIHFVEAAHALLAGGGGHEGDAHGGHD